MSAAEDRGKTQISQANETDVYAVYGVAPEVQAYAMAKYSRSSLSLRESLRELNQQRAEKFLNTFYFEYGHRSIADLAHIAMAIERLSLLAAIAVVDEQRWDGQERSTRYQDFSHPDYYLPDLAGSAEARRLYREAMDFLFGEYRFFSEQMFHYLAERTPRPAEMKEDAYQRTLRARTFDLARYLLPLASNTSLGQIVNARTLETQVSRLLASRHGEIRLLGQKLKEAARAPAYNANAERFRKFIAEIGGYDEDLGSRAAAMFLSDMRPAPTLVKYAEPNAYLSATREELEQAAQQVMRGAEIAEAPAVDLLQDEPAEIEVATSLLYEHCSHPYRQIRERVEALPEAERNEIIGLGTRHRGPHDELPRAFCAGQGFRFDILMDIGGFRDLHRHRRCVQLHQEFTLAHGYETPEDIGKAGVRGRYDAAMQRARAAAGPIFEKLAKGGDELIKGRMANRADESYLIPLAYRKRTLFKMDLAEVVYISELRTAPGGHFSYRKIAWEMCQTVARRHPSLSGCFRVHDVRLPVDLLQR